MMKRYGIFMMLFLVMSLPVLANNWETIVEIVEDDGIKLVKIDESRIDVETERDQKVLSFWLDINMKDAKAELQAEYLYKVYCTDMIAYELEGSHKYYYHKALISADSDNIPRKLKTENDKYMRHVMTLVCDKY